MDDIVLISDPRVLQVPISDNGDPLVDLHGFPIIKIDDRKRKDSGSYFKIRKAVADKLVEATKRLPEGMSFLVVEGYRPLSLQKRYFDGYSLGLKQTYPDWDERRIYDEASKFVAPPAIIPPHSTGGAVDLTLTHGNEELDMGTALNASPEESKNACFTDAQNITEEAKAHRKLLIHIMTSAGFVNYPTEWWHWSYGDRYWAYCDRNKHALYGSVE